MHEKSDVGTMIAAMRVGVTRSAQETGLAKLMPLHREVVQGMPAVQDQEIRVLFATLLHAVTNHLVDAVLALILMVGGVTGAQFGVRAGQKIRGEHLRLLLGLLVLAVGIRFAIELVIRPDDLFTIRETGGAG